MLKVLDRLVTILGSAEGDDEDSDGYGSGTDTLDGDRVEIDTISGEEISHLDRLIQVKLEIYRNYSPNFQTKTTIGSKWIDFVTFRVVMEFFEVTGACDDMITAALFRNGAACVQFMVAFVARTRYREFIESGLQNSAGDAGLLRLFWALKLIDMGIGDNRFRNLSEGMVLLYKSLLYCRSAYNDRVYHDEAGNERKVGYGDSDPYFISVAKKLLERERVLDIIFTTGDVPGHVNLVFSSSVVRYRAFLKNALKKTTDVTALWGLLLIDLGILGTRGFSGSRTLAGVIRNLDRNDKAIHINEHGVVNDGRSDELVQHIYQIVGNIPSLDEIYVLFCEWNGIEFRP